MNHMKNLKASWNFMEFIGLCFKEEILGIVEFHEVGRTLLEGLHEEFLSFVEFCEVGKSIA